MIRLIYLLILSTVFLTACDKSKPQIELIQDMMDQVSVKAQDYDPDDENGMAMRIPPEGTVPIGFRPYPYKDDVESAAKNLKNPYPDPATPEILARGKNAYEINCLVCHGIKGGGDGPVAEKMALRPPSLLTGKVQRFKDGRIFHIITEGRGVMGSYANQVVKENNRWAIITYIRSLQKLHGN